MSNFLNSLEQLQEYFKEIDEKYLKKYKESFNNRPSDEEFQEMSKLSDREKCAIRFYYCGMDISFAMYESIVNNLKQYNEKNNITINNNSSSTKL